MTPQKWHRIDPSGTGFKHSKVESGSAQLLYRYKGENDAKPYLLWKEGGGYFLPGGFGGYLLAWLCLQHFGAVFVALLMYLKSYRNSADTCLCMPAAR